MNIQIIAVGQKMPAWVDSAFEDYARRLPRQQAVTLSPIGTAARKSGHSIARNREQEAERIRKKIRSGGYLVCLDERGEQWTTRQWSERYAHWLQQYPTIDFVIGGPDGLHPSLLEQADLKLALGKLTMPHGLVRVVLMEQLYRVWSVLEGHPYHRE